MNMPILYQNTLAGFSETTGVLYLKLIDVLRSEKRAFAAACHYEKQCGATLDFILRNIPLAQRDDRTVADLSRFFAERWRHNFMQASPL